MGRIRMLQTGFTLIELLVTLSVIAILLAIGIPMYQSLTTRARVNGEIYAFLIDVNFARSEAIKRGQPVYVCSSADGATCNDTGAASSAWTTGRLVYVDTTGSGLVSTPPSTNILRISSGVTHNDTFTGGTAVQIAQTGYEFMTGTASVHDAADDIDQRRCISIVSGLATIATGANCP